MTYDPDKPVNVGPRAAHKYRSQGRIAGRIYAFQALRGDGTFSLSEWDERKQNEDPVLYYSCPAAHGWQVREKDGETVLDSAADPSDFQLVVFPDGWTVSGGSTHTTESFTLSERFLDRVKQLLPDARKELDQD
jgi:hypothetical protein